MTTEDSGYSANNAANNDIGHDYSSSNCILTNHTDPYWQVSLGQTYGINHITIFGIATGANGTYFLFRMDFAGLNWVSE